MKTLIICCSLSKNSKTNILSRYAADVFINHDQEVELLELSDYQLPICDGRECYLHPDVIELNQKVSQADCIIFSCPIYVYDLSAVAKNLVELTGRGSAWNKKSVGFICMAGTMASFMSVMPFANSLSFDYKCVIVPKFVYATAAAFEDNILTSEDIKKRLTELVDDVLILGGVSQQLSGW